MEKMTSKEMLEKAASLLGLNQRELGIYIGVSTRTINSWMTGYRECPDHVAELAYRLANVDRERLNNDMPGTPMMRWAFIRSSGIDEWMTVCGSEADAIREAETEWQHMTEKEKTKAERFEVCTVRVQLTDQRGECGRFAYAENGDSSIDGDVYDIAKDWLSTDD